MASPQRLIEVTGDQAVTRWPRTALDNLVTIDFDRKGKVWVTYPHGNHYQSIPLKEWLTLAAAALLDAG